MTENKKHSLLERQLRKAFGENPTLTPELETFINQINISYCNFDEDRQMLERSMNLSSQELMKKNLEMASVFQTMPDMFIWLDPIGQIINLKPGKQILSKHQVLCAPVGNKLQDVFSKEVCAVYSKGLGQLNSGESVRPLEYSITDLSDADSTFEARFVLLLDKISLIVVRDISEKIRREQKQLKTAKLESLGIMAAGIAHDFNNILMSLSGTLSLSLLSLESPVELEELMKDGEKSIQRASQLTRQLLNFSKGGEPIKKMVLLSDIIRDTVDFCVRGSNVKCEFALNQQLPKMEIDEVQIGQVIQNLAINAVHAMDNSGTLRVEVDFENDSKTTAKITVTDTGKGIDPKNIGRIFDPYFSTKDTGFGLGLYTSYSIIKSHGGNVDVESKIGKGTTFTIRLPLVLRAAEVSSGKNPKKFFYNNDRSVENGQ